MALEITWLGRTCFRLRGRQGVVLTDPCPPESGYKIGKQTVDIVTLSRKDDPEYSHTRTVGEGAKILDAPGEYEIGGILVSGIGLRRPDGTRNVIFVIEMEGIRVGHMGLLPGTPPATVLEELDDIDILLMPVGGGNSLDAAGAVDLMTTIDPKIAMPMNYKTEQERMELQDIDRFLKETGSTAEPLQKLSVTRSQLPNEISVMVLEPSGKS